MTRLTTKKWNNFQHYKDRAPPWIKLHRAILDNFDYQCLPIASKAIAPMLWLLASESNDGSIDGYPDKIAFRLRMSCSDVLEAVTPLIENGFFEIDDGLYQDASNSLEKCLSRERERERGEEEEEEEEEESKRESKRRREGREKPTRGSRLSADHTLTDEWLNEAMRIRADLPPDRIRAIYAEFFDYWIAQPGQKGVKTDWLATWRNWIRRERGFNRGGQIVKPEKFDPTRYVNDKDYAADWDARKNGGTNGRIIDVEAA